MRDMEKYRKRHNEASRRYRKNHPEKFTKEALAEVRTVWRSKNAVILKEKRRKKYLEHAEEYKQDRIDNKEKWKQFRLKHRDQRRKYRLQKTFGITIEQYNDMFLKQDGCCAICGKHQSEFKITLSVDHDHITGKVRGLLCGSCNTTLGNMNDDIILLNNAIEYLKKHNT